MVTVSSFIREHLTLLTVERMDPELLKNRHDEVPSVYVIECYTSVCLSLGVCASRFKGATGREYLLPLPESCCLAFLLLNVQMQYSLKDNTV